MPSPLARTLVASGLVAALCACRPVRGPGDPVPMGDWPSWQNLEPLVDLARAHAGKPVVAALREASDLLRDGRALSADRRLAAVTDPGARHWVAVARADLAALHFSTCIRGVAWRLADERVKPADRAIDFSPDARIEAGDVSVEAMLENLDAAVAAPDRALQVQARIARARVTAFVIECAPNEDVSDRAGDFMRGDLATLAAEGHLTPDLAYLWAGIQMNEYSGAAARPLLLQAQAGGFSDPGVTYLLAVIALGQMEYDEADRLASEAAKQYAKLGDATQEAQCHFIRGEVERARKRPKAARGHYERALGRMDGHAPALLAIAQLERDASGPSAATAHLHRQLHRLIPSGALDEAAARRAASNLEALVVLVDESLDLAEVVRDALLLDIDDEPDPLRRGLRYYFAATLDVRLGDYTRARGHGALARDELAGTSVAPVVDVERFLRHLDAAG